MHTSGGMCDLDDRVAGFVVHLAHVLLQFLRDSCVVMIVTRHLLAALCIKKYAPEQPENMPCLFSAALENSLILTVWARQTQISTSFGQ